MRSLRLKEDTYVSHNFKTGDLAEKLRTLNPNYNYPKNFVEVDEDRKMSSAKLRRIGWSYRALDETLINSAESSREAGLLD
ncbi:hypothetical protein M0R45_025621 [Rubus argutus]|uniref:Uncharacterized protein n=1 Tax=Rubus argutus TaxID=59490 RepID=A0AAW1WWT1_RUBAR